MMMICNAVGRGGRRGGGGGGGENGFEGWAAGQKCGTCEADIINGSHLIAAGGSNTRLAGASNKY